MNDDPLLVWAPFVLWAQTVPSALRVLFLRNPEGQTAPVLVTPAVEEEVGALLGRFHLVQSVELTPVPA